MSDRNRKPIDPLVITGGVQFVVVVYRDLAYAVRASKTGEIVTTGIEHFDIVCHRHKHIVMAVDRDPIGPKKEVLGLAPYA